MANFYGSGRTNYFRVKDADAFREEMNRFSSIEIHNPSGGVSSDSFCILVVDGDGYGGFPSEIWEEDQHGDGYPVEVDFYEIVAKHLADNEVAIFQHIGAEKLRYLTGYSIAVTNDDVGEPQFITVSIDDIYGRVRNEWNLDATTATY